MSVHDLATIEIVADDDSAVVSGGEFGFKPIKLSTDPKGLFSDELELQIIQTAFAPGGIAGEDEQPVRTLTLPFNLYDTGAGIEATVSRFRKLWRKGRTVQWRTTTQESGLRVLQLRRSKGIEFSPARDWNLQQCAKATVEAVALNPFYESAPLQVTLTNPSNGSNTLWAPVWNPTDQRGWPEYALRPNGGATSFGFPDFSFGNEQDIDVRWTPGQFAGRMIVTPPISVWWSVMSHPLMDTYVAADLSNAPAQMGAIDPLFWIPPYTGTQDNPIMMPFVINGPKGSQIKYIMRRFWSAESGLE
ncbi:hypothetical protein [Williamsia serinedens]|uniref:Minor tail protein n=1 Tax=Williamsia serinedens TaxID=391736 RepID=A0ABT1H7Q2_9NOCA|nr:hypothetical protein [Williamsia serinedens]MCP2162655.1 hypothetical protein [Williamsia serinedens]